MPDEFVLDTARATRLCAPTRQEAVHLCTDPCGSRGAEWFCVLAKHGQDEQAEAELTNQAFQCFRPMVWERRTRNRKIIRTEVPMFPGYLFVLFDRRTSAWGSIPNTKGVQAVLSMTPGRPTPTPAALLHLIAENASALNAQFEAQARTTLKGQAVRVNAGPWAGFEGVCTWHVHDRVRLLMSLFGRATQVEMPTGRVARA